MVLYTSISGFVNGAVVIILGLLSWLHRPKEKVNRLMALMCVSVAVWAISWAIQAPIQEKASALFWARMLNFGAIFVPILFLHWILALLEIEKKKKSKIILVLGYFLTLFFAFFAFTPYFVTVKPKPYFIYYSEPEILHTFYLLFCYFGLVGYALYNLLKSYKRATGYKKAQIKYVLLGSVLGFGGGATNYFLFYNIPIPPYGNPLVAVGLGLFTYSIIRYRLMDIRVIATEILVGIMGVILVILPFLMKTFQTRVLSVIILVIYCFIGYLLIKSVYREVKAKEQLKKFNQILERKVKERTKELRREKKLAEVHREIAEERARRLERWYSLTVGRELKMAELKQKIRELEEKIKKKSKE